MRITDGTWLVSARNRITVGNWERTEWRPYGQHHARKVGSLMTACGASAVEWPMFWDMEFDAGDPKACPECARAVARAESPEADG